MSIGDVTLDLDGFRIIRGREVHPITAIECGMLALLWGRRGRVVPREDFLGPADRPLKEAVCDRVDQQLGIRPDGPVRLLTCLRHFGHSFNPVSFYYCFAADGETLEHVVAEVNNTPWGEQHCYVLDAATALRDGGWLEFGLAKAFHVSPFMPMDIDYRWALSRPGEKLSVYMANSKDGEKIFDATMALERQPISAWALW